MPKQKCVFHVAGTSGALDTIEWTYDGENFVDYYGLTLPEPRFILPKSQT